MAVIQKEAWWMYAPTSMEVGIYHDQESAEAMASSMAVNGTPVFVLPVSVYMEED